MINRSNEGLKSKHHTCFQRLLGLRVVKGWPWCTLCVNELTSNLLWTKYLFVLQHPATARLRAVDCFRLIQHAMPQLPWHSGFGVRSASQMGKSPRDFHLSIPGVARTPVSYALWKPSSKKKWFLDHFNIDVVVIFDVVVRSPAPGIFVTANTFFLALCACCHPGLAWEGLFVLPIDPPQQQASLL